MRCTALAPMEIDNEADDRELTSGSTTDFATPQYYAPISPTGFKSCVART